jgi:RNA polymerase sigma-70 factor, ECF subfamily
MSAASFGAEMKLGDRARSGERRRAGRETTGSEPGPAVGAVADDWSSPYAASVPHSRSSESTDDRAADLFTAQYGRLAGWCRKLLDDDDTAHEIAMEAFTRLLGRLRQVDDPVGYLYVIAANLIRDHWRKTRRERTALRLSRPEGENTDSGTELQTLVESLPERLRICVLLYYYAGFPLADVARLTNRPAGTVKSDLFQARAVLRRALEGTR